MEKPLFLWPLLRGALGERRLFSRMVKGGEMRMEVKAPGARGAMEAEMPMNAGAGRGLVVPKAMRVRVRRAAVVVWEGLVTAQPGNGKRPNLLLKNGQIHRWKSAELVINKRSNL